MLSAEGEKVPLVSHVKARGSVESWLGAVEVAMRTALHKCFKTAIQDYEKTAREVWLTDHPSQVVLAVSQIFWAREVTRCLTNTKDPTHALMGFKAVQEQQLTQLAELVRGSLTPLQRGTLGALITIDVHARDIVDALIQERVSSESDFGWSKQLRYYWKDDNCVVLQANAGFKYVRCCVCELSTNSLTDTDLSILDAHQGWSSHHLLIGAVSKI
jgi:dynein heavy chain, axonemal